ncbi:MAG: cupredoxin domain-containing protein [Pseudorhodoplanes sp.]|nr:cupredoxin domain-containing protein [Pseudorhodoplanes sp.]
MPIFVPASSRPARDENGVWQFEKLLDTALQPTGAGPDANNELYLAMMTGEQNAAGSGSPLEARCRRHGCLLARLTVPLGQPRQGDLEVDEDGGVIAEGAETPEDETAPDEAQAPATAATPASTAQEATDDGAATAATEVVIGMYDIYFDPRKVTIPANTDVRLRFENRGEAPRTASSSSWRISRLRSGRSIR